MAKPGRPIPQRIIIPAALVAFAVFYLILSGGGPPDPIYDGKPLSQWLRQPVHWGPLSATGTSVIGSIPALKPDRLDTNAIPMLVYELDRRDGPFRRAYSNAWQKSPGWLQAVLPKPKDTAAIRRTVHLYLMNLHTFDSPVVIPAMARALELDTDSGIRQGSALFLGEGYSHDPAVIHALVHGLEDKDRTVRYQSTNSLRKLDPAALEKVRIK